MLVPQIEVIERDAVFRRTCARVRDQQRPNGSLPYQIGASRVSMQTLRIQQLVHVDVGERHGGCRQLAKDCQVLVELDPVKIFQPHLAAGH